MTPAAKRTLSFILRIVVCGAAVAYVVYSLSWNQLRVVLRDADWRWLAASVVALAPIPFGLALRIQWLMNANGIGLSLRRALAVTFAGNFANFVLPGQTSGDVIKAVLIARETDRRHEAATIVFFDRVVGLVNILILSGAMLLINWRDPAVKVWGRSIGVLLAAMVVPGVLYFSMSFRRAIGWDRLVDRLPLSAHIRRIDNAVLAYRDHRGVVVRCLAMSVMLQVFAILSTYCIGVALGVVGRNLGYTFQVYLLYIPLCWIVGALPLSPQGIGLVEAAYVQLLFHAAGFGTAEGATMISLLNRVVTLLWALPGVVVYLRARRVAKAPPQ